ncbi:MAG: CCA tRNA nucleotidyltransferase, partial [Planctomycetota bacterium]
MHSAQPQKSGDSPDRHAAVVVVRALQEAGHVAYFAGGCVRDELLGLTPSDYDVATDATPDRIASLFRRTAAVGASFGVMLVKEGQSVIEVATFRADGTYLDNRRPDSVRFSTPQDDARRRDFTVNALFLDPLDTQSGPGGRVIDHVGGLGDLARRVIRAVGDPDQRLGEDHLRALRAVRLSAKLGFSISPETAEAIARHTGELSGVSRERIGDEVRLMLGHPTRSIAIDLLQGLGLDAAVLGAPAGPSGRLTLRLAKLGPSA